MTTKESKRSYLTKRDRRIRELWYSEGLGTVEIVERMLGDGTLRSETYDSALRTVRGVVKKIRERIDLERRSEVDAEIAASDVDAMERRLRRLREEYAQQIVIRSGEPDEDGKEAVTIVTMMGANGDPFQFEKPKWPAGVRQKASKDAAILAEKIAALEIDIATKRTRGITGAEDSTRGGLTIIESDKPIEELIRLNGVN